MQEKMQEKGHKLKKKLFSKKETGFVDSGNPQPICIVKDDLKKKKKKKPSIFRNVVWREGQLAAI